LDFLDPIYLIIKRYEKRVGKTNGLSGCYGVGAKERCICQRAAKINPFAVTMTFMRFPATRRWPPPSGITIAIAIAGQEATTPSCPVGQLAKSSRRQNAGQGENLVGNRQRQRKSREKISRAASQCCATCKYLATFIKNVFGQPPAPLFDRTRSLIKAIISKMPRRRPAPPTPFC